jgi:UDP-N-acetylmuramate dehydrogenase
MENEIFEILKKELLGIKKNVSLAHYTTFKIGGPADYFLIVKKKKDLIKAITIAKKLKLPVFVLGGGSNLLISDEGFSGLVIKIQFTKYFLDLKHTIASDAGVIMNDLVSYSIKKGLAGLEWAGGLPGTFGGAIRGNAGAFGGEIKDSVLQVEALDNNLKLRKLSYKQCQFSYRSSIFKEKNWPVIFAKLQFKKGAKKDLQSIAKSHIEYRKEKHPLEYPNAGSVFKNVDFKKISPKIKKLFLDKVKKDPFPIVPSAWFIIGAGLVGKKIGQAQISKKHSNYIVNLGGAKAKDVLRLIEFVKKVVKKKYGIVLEQEIQYLE